MVLNREVKEDVFAGFQIGLEVGDNNEKKLQELVELQTKGPTQFVGGKAAPKEDVYAQFKIDEKEHQLQLAEEEQIKAAASAWPGPLEKNSRQSGTRIPVPRRLTSFIGRNKNNLDPMTQSERPTLRNERRSSSFISNANGQSERPAVMIGRRNINTKRWQSERVESWDMAEQKPRTTDLRRNSSRFLGEQENDNSNTGDDKVVAPGRYRRKRQPSNLKALSEDQPKDDFHDSDLPTHITVTEDSRDRASFATPTSQRNSAENISNAAAEGRVPQGVVPLSDGEELMDDIFRLDKPGYDVFADFDLDGIVRDYERMQRKINHAPVTENKGTAKNDDNQELDHYAALYRYRSLKQMWLDNFPRLHGIIFRILAPLWILVAISLLLGHVLAGYEEESEYQANDGVMVNRFLFQQLPYRETIDFMLELPTTCFDSYLLLKKNNTNVTLPPEFEYLFGEDFLDLPSFNNSANGDGDEFDQIAEYMVACEALGLEIVSSRINFTDTKAAFAAATGTALSFDWIRCWDTDVYGDVNPVFPNKEQIQAANNQSDFYASMWEMSRVELFDKYMDEYECTNITCEEEALERSIYEATGSGMCGLNNGGSAWFWFIVMTTVGYGNQSPVTMEGRALVSGLGWITIIAWAVVWIVAGKVTGIILDDMFRKIHLRFLTGEWISATFFGFLGWLWMLFMAWIGLIWWDERIEDHGKSLADSLWWSYISLLSVGLGDYFLEPEVFFYQDVAIWSFMFLTGFTFLSTFLDKIAILSEGYFPDSGDALKERIRNTNLVGHMTIEFKQKNEVALENLGEIVKKMDDEDVKNIRQRVTRIREKKEVLIRLLYQTEQELDHFTQRGEQYEESTVAQVSIEENMLEEVLEKTRKEREKLARYRVGVPKVSKDQPLDNNSKHNSRQLDISRHTSS